MRNFHIVGDNGGKLIVMADSRENALRWPTIVRTEHNVRSLVYAMAHVFN